MTGNDWKYSMLPAANARNVLNLRRCCIAQQDGPAADVRPRQHLADSASYPQ
jgi:hypothetical protein